MGNGASYLNIAEHYARQISEDILLPGDALPTVREVAEAWGVSAATAHHAMKELRNRHQLMTVGRRLVVGATTMDVAIVVPSQVKVLDTTVLTATPDVAAGLGVGEGCSVVLLKLAVLEGRHDSPQE